MANDQEIRGKFGYEGEGYDETSDAGPRSREISADRGWNIGRADDREDDEGPPAGRHGRQR
jgi:hypothetical protein